MLFAFVAAVQRAVYDLVQALSENASCPKLAALSMQTMDASQWRVKTKKFFQAVGVKIQLCNEANSDAPLLIDNQLAEDSTD